MNIINDFGIYPEEIEEYTARAEDIIDAAKTFVMRYDGVEVDGASDSWFRNKEIDDFNDLVTKEIKNRLTNGETNLSDVCISAAFDTMTELINNEPLFKMLDVQIETFVNGYDSHITLFDENIVDGEHFEDTVKGALVAAVKDIYTEIAQENYDNIDEFSNYADTIVDDWLVNEHFLDCMSEVIAAVEDKSAIYTDKCENFLNLIEKDLADALNSKEQNKDGLGRE